MEGSVPCLRIGLTLYHPTRFARFQPGALISGPQIYKHWRT